MSEKAHVNRVYRVKTPQWMLLREEAAPVEQGAKYATIALWSVATGVGAGVGWYLAQTTKMPSLMALSLGVCQGLVLLRNWKIAATWALVTTVAWAVVLSFTPITPFLLGRGWTTAGSGAVGIVVTALVVVGVPIVTIAQCLIIRKWSNGQDAMLWFGVSGCSFPIIAFVGAVLAGAWLSKGFVRGLTEIDPFEPRIWIIGAVWGACLGWGMAGIPQVNGLSRVGEQSSKLKADER